MHRITLAETVAGPEFQYWLRGENSAGADIFIGMNPLKDGADGRTKGNIREIRHLYLDLAHWRPFATRLKSRHRTLPSIPLPVNTIWKVEGLDREQAESKLARNQTRFITHAIS